MFPSEQNEKSGDRRDVVDLLHERHEQLLDLFTEVVTAEGPERSALFDELITLLAVHEAVEREMIRPLAERVGPLAPAAGTRLMAEADAVDALVRLSDMAVDDEAFDLQLTRLARVVAMQIRVEEREELPRLRKALSSERLIALAETLRAAESGAILRASDIQPDVRPPEDLGPIAVFHALQDAMRRAVRP